MLGCKSSKFGNRVLVYSIIKLRTICKIWIWIPDQIPNALQNVGMLISDLLVSRQLYLFLYKLFNSEINPALGCTLKLMGIVYVYPKTECGPALGITGPWWIVSTMGVVPDVSEAGIQKAWAVQQLWSLMKNISLLFPKMLISFLVMYELMWWFSASVD